MDEKDRIEKIMQVEKMSAAVFATEIGIQGSTLSHILNGRNNPSLEVLKKILNRFRTISSDWLILGVGPMYRTEKQSQALTLFDNIDENISKSNVYAENPPPNINQLNSNIQSKSVNSKPVDQNLSAEGFKIPITQNIPASKSVKKIIVYYTDNTFQEFETK
jgi:transcriptional regulator with XRE-family HTH domain